MRGNFVDDIDQRFNELRREMMSPLHERGLGGPGLLGREVRAPEVDIQEERDKYLLTADLPGVDKQDIHLEVEQNGIILRAEKKQEKKEEDVGFIHRERTSRRFSRFIRLPERVDAKKAKATFRNGVLHVDIPKVKPEERQAQEVKID